MLLLLLFAVLGTVSCKNNEDGPTPDDVESETKVYEYQKQKTKTYPFNYKKCSFTFKDF